MLRLHMWSFARRQVSIALLGAAKGTTENPSGTERVSLAPWSYEYLLPNDCLRVRQILQNVGGASAVPYALSGDTDDAGNAVKVILTNQPQAVLIYTARITDTDMHDPEFEEALVYALGSKLAMALGAKKAWPNPWRNPPIKRP